MSKPKILAFILPQFHRIPENDAWWGEGFTEWTNVRKAASLYPGHAQPRVPEGGRYYDLTDPATHDWQASLARAHGIHGFCYYHYWFDGRQLLERPVEVLLERGRPDFPFCLAWANEPWTRAWDGGDREVLMPQSYGAEQDWRRHFDYLLRAFRDARYIRVDGKPVFLIYRSAGIDACGPMLRCWRELALRADLPGLHIVGMLTSFQRDERRELFDAFVEFEPMYTLMHRLPYWVKQREKWLSKWTRWQWRVLGRAPRVPKSYDYAEIWRLISRRPLGDRCYPGAFPDWDNTPRRGVDRSIAMRNFSRDAFKDGIAAQLRKASAAGAEFMFVNAWNEWAEGAYLEPDEQRGRLFLESIRDAAAP